MNYVTVQICFITFCNHKNRNLKKMLATREQSKSNSEYTYILPHRIFYSKKLPVKVSTTNNFVSLYSQKSWRHESKLLSIVVGAFFYTQYFLFECNRMRNDHRYNPDNIFQDFRSSCSRSERNLVIRNIFIGLHITFSKKRVL